MKVETTRVGMWLALMVFMASMVEQGVGQGCARSFISALLELTPCRAAVTPTPFSPIPPNEACCTALRDLGQSCLCVLLSSPLLSGVDRTLASQLPTRCALNYAPCEGGI